MQNRRTREFFTNTALLTWFALCLVIFMYFPGSVSHMQGVTLYDPSTLPEKLEHISLSTYLLDILTAFLGTTFFGISCVSLGMTIFKVFRLNNMLANIVRPHIVVLIPTYFLIGNMVFSLVFLTLASLTNLSVMHSAFLLGLGILSGLGQFRKLTVPAMRFNAEHGKVIIMLSLAILTTSLLQTSTRISYDASAIYFSNAKLTALQRHVGYYMDNTFVVSVFHSIIQYTAVMQVFGDQAARMISWLFGAVNILMALALANHVGASDSARRILPAFILTSTAFLDLMGDGKVDLFSTAYSLAAVYWLNVGTGNFKQNRSLYFVAGCFIGFACILRPYNAFLLGMFIFAYAIIKIRTGMLHIFESVNQTGWMALGAVGFAIYHFLINKLMLGSPFAFWANVTSINPIDGPWDFRPETVWIYRLLYPVIITFKNNPASLGNITPLVVLFVPALAVPDIRKRINISKAASRLVMAAAITLASWIFLFFTIVEIRYVLFLWIILFIPLSEVAASAMTTNISLVRNAVKWCVVLLMSFVLVRSAYISISAYAPLDAQKNPQCLDNFLCSHFTPINEIAGKNERVLTLSAFRYYLRTDLFACSTTLEEYRRLQTLSHTDVELFWREVERMGYSFVAFEEDYATRHLGFSDEPFHELPNWVQLSPIAVASENLRIIAYRLTTFDSPVNAKIVCEQDESGVWRLSPQELGQIRSNQ